MDIDKQARESATTERQHQQQREATMESRSKAETAMPSRDGVEESAREGMTHERQHDQNREANMQSRAHEGR
ncbi:hypothetical protein [Leptolyngbya iicbica]|uniref:Uncharacterized protein n=2 Tax=Cyanophyceae TaxID=3028117 RepID=A0A4V2E2I8_9CYAN|nr:hypothetical protein [Leptolyngbya sp. LK]RZM78706.1 hypothetical protein DYY88_07850 [Leptolyngbya sp. LK]